MKLVRREEPEQRPVPLSKYGAVYWKDTEIGRFIINGLKEHFTPGNNVPTEQRFTAVTKDGMLYYNDSAEELKDILYMIDRWIPQEKLNYLIDYGTENLEK